MSRIEEVTPTAESFEARRRGELERRRDAIDADLIRNRADVNGLRICVEQSYDEVREELDRLTNERACLMQAWNETLRDLAALTPTTEFSQAR